MKPADGQLLTTATAATRVSARANRDRDSGPELRPRAPHARGPRSYVDRTPLAEVRHRADLIFPRLRLAVFVNGCTGHSCPLPGTAPTTNAAH